MKGRIRSMIFRGNVSSGAELYWSLTAYIQHTAYSRQDMYI